MAATTSTIHDIIETLKARIEAGSAATFPVDDIILIFRYLASAQSTAAAGGNLTVTNAGTRTTAQVAADTAFLGKIRR